MTIIGQIPARGGSKRVPRKNLRLFDGQPLIQYAITAAREAKMLSAVYVNTDSEEIAQLATANGVEVYRRPPDLGSDATTQDEFNYDFIRAKHPDVLVMINPMSPLIDGHDIDQMVAHFLEHGFDTLVAGREDHAHTLHRDIPVNFDREGRLARTQDLSPIQVCTWSVGIWRAATFIQQFEARGHAAFSGKVGFYPLNRFKSVKISTDEDFILAEILMRNMHRWKFPPVPYDSEQVDPRYPSMWLSEIRWIERLLEEQARERQPLNILEWGAGRSTTYFSMFLKERGIAFRWLALENYIPWHREVRRLIETHQLTETTTCVLKNGTCEERKYVQETLDLTEYLNYPASLSVPYDVIFIDGRRRRACLELASRLLRPTGVAVLHDAERPDYQPAFASYADGGRYVCENPSPVPGGVQRLWAGRPLQEQMSMDANSGKGVSR